MIKVTLLHRTQVLEEPFRSIASSNFERISLCFTPMAKTFDSISKLSRYYSHTQMHLNRTVDRVSEALIVRVSQYCDARYILSQSPMQQSMARVECAVETLSKWLDCCQKLPTLISRGLLTSALRRCSELKCLLQGVYHIRDDLKRYDAIKTMLCVGLCDPQSGMNVNVFDDDTSEVLWEQLYETAMRRIKDAMPPISQSSVLKGRLYDMLKLSRAAAVEYKVCVQDEEQGAKVGSF